MRVLSGWVLGVVVGLFAVLVLLDSPSFAGSFLFDATKHEMGGNADWIVDADQFDLNMPAFPCTGTSNESRPARFPTPAAAGITGATPETYWTGAISAWAVGLVKAGHNVETLPPGASITYGEGGNPQDLSHYDVFIVPEPQNPFTAAEKAAILAFVNDGGGLFMVADHETSDRDCDGWDAPHVFNDLTGATSTTSGGVFGMWFRVDGSDAHPSDDWFDEAVDNNVEVDPVDPIIEGPFGSGAGGLGLFGSTSMDLDTTSNATVRARIWRVGQVHDAQRVTFATASYGLGRVAAIGDSSPADDGTGDPSDSLHPGWDKASGGVANREIHLNACHWLLNPVPDTTPPAITSGPAASAVDCSAAVTWNTDEAATSLVEYGPTAGYGSSESGTGFVQNHSVTILGLAPTSLYHYRVSSLDAAGNGPTQSSDATFTTSAPSAPMITISPTVVAGSTNAAIAWTTDEPSTSVVEYGMSTDYGSSASTPGLARDHFVSVSGLTPSTLYHYRVLSTDGCANGPAASGDGTFTTGAPSIDVSGWTLRQFNSSLSFVLPTGASIPSGGYLVVGRDATRAEFLSTFPSMPASTQYIDSNSQGGCANGCFPQINGSENFLLSNATNTTVDGTTISMSTGSAYQRVTPGSPSGNTSSWNIVPMASANPGQGAGTGSGAGVRINEMSDASNFTREFVELYYDGADPSPDATPPAAVVDLTAIPVSESSVRLQWTAVGDDGQAGTAALYDVRMSASRILTEADFAAASPLTGEPTPQPAGSYEQFLVNGLSANTPYYFAMEVSDESSNRSGRSNSDGAVTSISGGGPPPANHLVISQVQTSGDGSNPSDDEFVEIYNPTGASVPLSGLSIQYKSATGSTYTPFALPSLSIPSHGWFLVARSAYNGSPAADAVNGSIQMAAAGGNIFLVNGTGALSSSPCSASPSIIDKLGYGTGNCAETAAPSVPGANNSLLRKPGGAAGSGVDTNNNVSDFQPQTPATPHNRFETPASPPTVLGNVGPTLFLTGRPTGTELDWANAAGSSGYRVYRGTAGGFMGSMPAPWSTPTSSILTDSQSPVPAGVFFYLVRATDGVAESQE